LRRRLRAASTMQLTGTLALAAFGITAARLRAAEPSHSIWDGVYTAEQAQRGSWQFASHCAPCHGATLAGTGAVPALAGPTFLYNWDGLALKALFDRIHVTMPMDNPGSLSPQTATDITAFILSVNQIPAGNTKLSDDAQTLKNLRFDAKRPE